MLLDRILDKRLGPESGNTWEVTLAELGDYGWRGWVGDTFLPYLSIKPGGEKRAWDQDLVDGEKSRLCEFRFLSPTGLSSNPSSITYYLGHLGKGLNLQNLFPHLQSGDNNNIYLTGLQEKNTGQPIQNGTDLGALEAEVPLRSCLGLTSPKLNNTDNPRLTSRFHPKSALKDTRKDEVKLPSQATKPSLIWGVGGARTAS